MKSGVALIAGGFALAALLLVGWLVGLIGGFGGGLIHLLLLLAPVAAVAGTAVGIVLILRERGRNSVQM